MAARKAGSAPESKGPSMSAARARALLEAQLKAGRDLLALREVERLAFDGWEQTTRAVVVAAFGESSDNVGRFDRASPSYAARIGEDEAFWAKYRRDELEAKLVSVESGISQLAMGLASTDGPRELHPYEAARQVLKVLHHYFLELGNLSWSISPMKHGEDNFASVGLDEANARKALRMLASKGLAKYVGQDAFVITDLGIGACDHPATLNRVLPVEEDSTPSGDRGAPPFDLTALAKVSDLLVNEDLRDVIVRDIAELGRAMQSGLSKSAMLLSGSILEGILVEVLDRNRAVAATYLKKRRFPEDASLQDLIGIAGDDALLEAPRHLLTPTSVALAKAVTEHRDLIHPHAEARGRITVDPATAQALCHLVIIVVRDLLEAKDRGDIAAYESK